MTCKCPLCGEEIAKKLEVDDHFLKEHKIEIESEILEFKSMEDYKKWKGDMEKETCSKFVKKRGALKDKYHIQHFYQCHRSGNYVFKGKGLRRLKTIGSHKINGTCPASFNVFEKKNGKCTVIFKKTHVGHINELNRLNLNNAEMNVINNKLKENQPFSSILRDIREYAESNDLKRLTLLTNKELHNIKFRSKMKDISEIGDKGNTEMFVNQRNYKEDKLDDAVKNKEINNGKLVVGDICETSKQIVSTNVDAVELSAASEVCLQSKKEDVLRMLRSLIDDPKITVDHLNIVCKFLEDFKIDHDL